MNRSFQICATDFAIPVTMEEYDRIDEHDSDALNSDKIVPTLSEKLNEIPGVYHADYNGHFGLFIYLTIEKKYHNDATLHKISSVINEAVKG
jgi:hypothetical protein